MFKGTIRFFSENVYLFMGILIGLYFSNIFSYTETPTSCTIKTRSIKNETVVQEIINSSVNKLAPKPLIKKSVSNPNKPKLIRPRYYSTELGIREKLFVGIFTSEEKINSQAIHINKTIGHIVDKIKFFITAQYKLKTKYNLTGLVGFTDSRHKYRPFQVIKFVADTFSQDYDYYFFANDYTFINAHRLNEIVKKISVSMDVYLGKRVKDGSYCNLDSGILISNSVLKAMRNHLDWCIMNAVSEDPSENIGRCAYHSFAISCQESVQMESLPSFKIKHFELLPHLKEMTMKQEFNEAVTVYPVLKKDDFYTLNAYFLKQRLATLHEELQDISALLTGEGWPPGQRQGAKPATRFDLPRQYYFNASHVFFPDDFSTLKQLNKAELKEHEEIIEEIKLKTLNGNDKNLKYMELVNGYKVFDLSRGMDYTLDIKFEDLNSGKQLIKRFDVCKPLGNIEIIPVPYVTENTRVNILFPVQETEVPLAIEFLTNYASLVMERKEKTFLLVILLYQYNSESKSSKDPFAELKNFSTAAANKYKNDDVKIAWLSIRLPDLPKPLYLEDNRALNFAVVDLALKKIGLDSLTLILDVYCNISVEFLNRVRMNTIQDFQIFNPIPFRQYNPKVTQTNSFDINKFNGHFDKEEYKYISFYGKDYVIARKKHQHILPLIRVDYDISNILDEEHKTIGNIFEMFVKYNDKLNCMRATEMGLKIRYHDETDERRKNVFLGSEAELAKLMLTKKEIYEAS